MANTVVINGDKRKFTLNAELKLYALIDAGFVKTAKGNFNYEHPLYNDSPYNAPTKLKITINKALDHGLWLSLIAVVCRKLIFLRISN